MVEPTQIPSGQRPTVGGAIRSEPWSFVLLALAGGLVAGLLFKSPLFRRAFRVYRKAATAVPG